MRLRCKPLLCLMRKMGFGFLEDFEREFCCRGVVWGFLECDMEYVRLVVKMTRFLRVELFCLR